jgi:hypothetical protein
MTAPAPLAGLADIVGPQAPAAVASSATLPLLATGALIVVLLLTAAALGYRWRHARRRRALLRLLERPAPSRPEHCATAAAEIAAALRALRAEADWPAALRERLGALRYRADANPAQLDRLRTRLSAALRARRGLPTLNPDRRVAARLSDADQWLP